MEKLYSNHRGNKYLKILNTKKGNEILLEQVLGDSFQKQLSGKNKIVPKTTLKETTVNGITYTPVFNDDGTLAYINANGTATANADYGVASNQSIALGDYVFNGCASGGSASAYMMFVTRVSSEGTWERDYIDYGGGVSVPITDETALHRMAIRVVSGATVSNVKFYPMLSTDGGEYEPYCGGTASPNPIYPQEIESVDTVTIKAQNKNVFDEFFNLSSRGNNASATSSYSNGVLTITTNGTTSSGIYCHPISSRRNKLTGKTVTLSADVTITDGTKVMLRIGDGNTTHALTPNVKTRVSFTYTYSDTTNLPIIIYSSEAVVKTITVENIQLEYGSVATDYIPHAEHEITIPLSEPLRAINDVKDEICVQDGVYGAFRKIHEKNLAELEWSMSTSYAYPIFYASISDKKIESIDGLSNKFTFDAVNTSAYAFGNHGADNTFAFVASNTQILVRCDAYTDVESFKEAMGDAVAQYELATPVFEPFEDQTPFQNIKAFDDLTQFQVENISDNLNVLFSVNYMEIEGKTDWTAETPINSADGNGYNRIINNLKQLKAFADTLFNDLTDVSLGEEKDYLSLIYAREMNAIEDALETINLETANLEIGGKQIFRANGKTPIYTEYNRIESAILSLYKTLMSQKNALSRLSFRLGGQKGIRV